MGNKESQNFSDLDARTHKNLRSLGSADSAEMRILAIKNACHYENPLSLLLDILRNESSEQVLCLLESAIVDAVSSQNEKAYVKQQVSAFQEDSSLTEHQYKAFHKIIRKLS